MPPNISRFPPQVKNAPANAPPTPAAARPGSLDNAARLRYIETDNPLNIIRNPVNGKESAMTIQEVRNARQTAGAGAGETAATARPPQRRPRKVGDLTLKEFERRMRFIILDEAQNTLENCGLPPDPGRALNAETAAALQAAIDNPGELIPLEQAAQRLGLNPPRMEPGTARRPQYAVLLTPAADASLAGLDPMAGQAVLARVGWLVDNFHLTNHRRLDGLPTEAYQMGAAAGFYRLLYDFDHDRQRIVIRLLPHRIKTYQWEDDFTQ